MSKTFQRVLLEVFYSSLLLDLPQTLSFLHQSGFLLEFFSLSFDNWKSLRLSYERKLFILAMTDFIFNSSIPVELQDKCGMYLREVVCLLMR
jgi:hypothetical protein